MLEKTWHSWHLFYYFGIDFEDIKEGIYIPNDEKIIEQEEDVLLDTVDGDNIEE